MSGPSHENGASGSGSPNNLTPAQHPRPTSPAQYPDKDNQPSAFLDASQPTFFNDSSQDPDDATNFAALLQQIQDQQSSEADENLNVDDANTSVEIDSVAAALSEQILRALNSSHADTSENPSNHDTDDFSADPYLPQSSSSHLQDPVRQNPSQNVPETLPPPSPPPKTNDTHDDHQVAPDLEEVADIDVQQLLDSVSALTQNLKDDSSQELAQSHLSQDQDITSSLSFLQDQLAAIVSPTESSSLSNPDQHIFMEDDTTHSFSDDALLSQISEALSRNAALAAPEKVEDSNNPTSPIDISKSYDSDSAMTAAINSAAGAAAEALVNAVTTDNATHIDTDDSTGATTDNFNEIIFNAFKMALDLTGESTSDHSDSLTQDFSSLSSLPPNDHLNDNNDHLINDNNNDLKNTTEISALDSVMNDMTNENEDDVSESLKFLSGILMQAEQADKEQEHMDTSTSSSPPHFVPTTKAPMEPPQSSFQSQTPLIPFQPVNSPASVLSPVSKAPKPVPKPVQQRAQKPISSSTYTPSPSSYAQSQERVLPSSSRVSSSVITAPPSHPPQKVTQSSTLPKPVAAPNRQNALATTSMPSTSTLAQTRAPVSRQRVSQKPVLSHPPAPVRPPPQQQFQVPQPVTTAPAHSSISSLPSSTSTQITSARRPSTTSSSHQPFRHPSISFAARRRSRANSFKAVAAAIAKKRHFSFDGNRFAIEDDDDDDENAPVSESQQQAIMAQLASLLGQDSDFLMGDDEAIDESEEIDALSQPNSPDLSAMEHEMAQSILRQLEQHHSSLFPELEQHKPLPEPEPIVEEQEEPEEDREEGDIDLEKVLAEAIGKSLTEQIHQQEEQSEVVEEPQEGSLDYSSVLSALQQAIQEAVEEQPIDHMDLDGETSDIDEDVFKPSLQTKPVEQTQEDEERFLASDIEAALRSLLNTTISEEHEEQPTKGQVQQQQLQPLPDEDEESLQTATMLVETLLNSGLVSLEQIAALGQQNEVSEEIEPEPIQPAPQMPISKPQQQLKQPSLTERPPIPTAVSKQPSKPATKPSFKPQESVPSTAPAATPQPPTRVNIDSEQQYQLHQKHQNDVLQMQNKQLQLQHQQLQQLQQQTSGFHPPLPPLPQSVIPSLPIPFTKPQQTQPPKGPVPSQQPGRTRPPTQQKPAAPSLTSANASVTLPQQIPNHMTAPAAALSKQKPKGATTTSRGSVPPQKTTMAPSPMTAVSPQVQNRLPSKTPPTPLVSASSTLPLKTPQPQTSSTWTPSQNQPAAQNKIPTQSSIQFKTPVQARSLSAQVQTSKVHAPPTISTQGSTQQVQAQAPVGSSVPPKSTPIPAHQIQASVRIAAPSQPAANTSSSASNVAPSTQSPPKVISPTRSPLPPSQSQQQQQQQQPQSSQPTQRSSTVGSMSIAETLAFARAHMSLKPAENKIDPMIARREMNLAALRARQSSLGGSSVLSTAQALVSSAIAGVRAAAAGGSSSATGGPNRNFSTDKYPLSLRGAGINSNNSGGVKYKMYTPASSSTSGSGNFSSTFNANSRQGTSASSSLGNTLANSLGNLSMRPRAASSQTKFYYYTPPGKTAGQSSSERPTPAFSSIPRFSTEPSAMNNMRRSTAATSSNNMSTLLTANQRNLARDLVSGRMTPASTAAASAIAAAAVQATGSRHSSSSQEGGTGTGASQSGVAANVIKALLLAKQMMTPSNGEPSNSAVDEDGDVQMEDSTNENRSVDNQTMEAIQEALQALGRSLQDGEPESTGPTLVRDKTSTPEPAERLTPAPVSVPQPAPVSATISKQPPLDDKAFEVPDMTGMSDKERVRVLNRLRKKRWRYNNLDRNRDNDLRTRVVRQATKLYGSENTPEKLAWIEKEFNQRKTRRRDRSTTSVPYTMVQKPTPAGLVVANRSAFHPGGTSTTTTSLPGGKLTVTPASSFAKPLTPEDPSASAALASARRSVDAFNSTITAQSRKVLTTIDLTKSSDSNTPETAIAIESDHEEEMNSTSGSTSSPNKRKRSISSDHIAFSAPSGPPASLSFKAPVGFTTVPHPKLSRIGTSGSGAGVTSYPPRTVFTANLLPCQILHNNFNDKSIPKPLPYTPPVPTSNGAALPQGSVGTKNSAISSTAGNVSTNGSSILGPGGISMTRGVPGGPTAGLSAAAGSASNKPGFLSRFPRFNLSAATRPPTLTGGVGPVMNLSSGPPASLSGGMPPSSLLGGGMTGGNNTGKGLTPPLSISGGGGVLSRQAMFNNGTTTTLGGSGSTSTSSVISAGGSTASSIGSGTSSNASGTMSSNGPSASASGHATPRASAPVVVTGPIRP